MDNLDFIQDVIILKFYSSLIHGGNNDTQRLLSNITGLVTCMEKNLSYENFLVQLNIHGCVGFEQYTASHLIENYVYKYATKGVLTQIIGKFYLKLFARIILIMVIRTKQQGLFM